MNSAPSLKHRQVKCRSGLQFLVVHVAAEGTWHRRTAAAPRPRGRHADDAEERFQREFSPPRQNGNPARVVHGGVDRLVLGEFVRQGSQQGKDRNETPVHSDLRIEDVDLQRVAGLRTAHVDRTGDKV
jgi:hypothetical protein